MNKQLNKSTVTYLLNIGRSRYLEFFGINLLLGFFLFMSSAIASDHQDAPMLMQKPEVDISDLFAFTNPQNSDKLVMIMNVFPLATESSWFAPDFEYSLVARPTKIVGTGEDVSFVAEETEFRFSCYFEEPQSDSDSTTLSQTGNCLTPDGRSIPVNVNDEEGTSIPGVRIFAGLRSDTFFLDFKNLAQGNLAPGTQGKNSLEGKNVLSLAIEVDAPEVFNNQETDLLSIIGEIHTHGKPAFNIDRQGRSEITNITLSFKNFDRVNKELDVRDIYNQETTFMPSEDYRETFRARFNANLSFWDGLDGKTDWITDESGQHPLTNLLMNDVLLIDPSKPCKENGFLEIEKSLLKNLPYRTCGGRKPNFDTVDSLINFYIHRDRGMPFTDGADTPTTLADDEFPYLPAPNL